MPVREREGERGTRTQGGGEGERASEGERKREREADRQREPERGKEKGKERARERKRVSESLRARLPHAQIPPLCLRRGGRRWGYTRSGRGGDTIRARGEGASLPAPPPHPPEARVRLHFVKAHVYGRVLEHTHARADMDIDTRAHTWTRLGQASVPSVRVWEHAGAGGGGEVGRAKTQWSVVGEWVREREEWVGARSRSLARLWRGEAPRGRGGTALGAGQDGGCGGHACSERALFWQMALQQ